MVESIPNRAKVLNKFLLVSSFTPEDGVNCSLLEGDLSEKNQTKAFVGIFYNSLEGSGYIYSLPVNFDKDPQSYDSKILRLNPAEGAEKIIEPILVDKELAGMSIRHLKRNSLPVMLFVFSQNRETKEEVVEFYYPVGMVLEDALGISKNVIVQGIAKSN